MDSFKPQKDVGDDINKISKQILDICFKVHTHLGPGLLEKIYEEAVYYFLIEEGIKVEKQKPCRIIIDGHELQSEMRFDLIVEDCIILELKTVDTLQPIHFAQIHSYLKLSGCPLGLLINFNVKSLKDGIKRVARTKTQ